MIIFRNKLHGAATLVMAVVLLTLGTLIILSSANYGILQQKTASNIVRATQAATAASAGIEYGVSYLKQNLTTIIANPVSGYLAANSFSGSFSNGSNYTFSFSNPVANDYTLIKITATGTSEGGTATRTISELIKTGNFIVSPSPYAVTTTGTVTIGGSSEIYNNSSSQTIQAGGNVTFSGSGHTKTSAGNSCSNSQPTCSDVSKNISALSTQSQDQFFINIFGANTTVVQGLADLSFTNSSSTNYSSTLNNKQGKFIWINQTNGSTATINGNVTIGSPTNPVVLVVNGSFSMSGNSQIYGYVIVIGTGSVTSTTGSSDIYGNIASFGSMSFSGSSNVVRDTTALSNISTVSSLTYVAKVAGSWKDF